MTKLDQQQTLSPFHAGEIEAQERMGVADQMARFGAKVIRPFMPDQHRAFFNQLPILFAGHVDPQGWPWATALTGRPGFMSSGSATSLEIEANPVDGDPLLDDLEAGKKLGLLGIELHTRRRNRLNVTVADMVADKKRTGFSVFVDQSFGNCPQYIQTRNIEFTREPGQKSDLSRREDFTELDDGARQLIEQTDTFFVASYADAGADNPSSGADMSHRGGRPGFVKVTGDTLTIPDYVGNFHFNTLGNFIVNPKAGLLFINFDTGDMLQLTGTTQIHWGGPEVDFFKGAERAWTFTLDHGVWLRDALPLRWEFGEMSLNSLLTGSWEEARATEQAEVKRQQWRDFEVVDISDESSVIKSFYLQPADDAGLLPYDAGQYLTVRINPLSPDKPCVRTYTLSSAPLDKSYRISVKKEGQVSGFLHDEIKVGDVIQARAPMGSFVLDAAEQRPAVLLSAGIGITPMIAMMRLALQEGYRTRSLRPVTLIHSARTKAERAFFDEAQDLVQKTGAGMRYVSLLGKPTDADIIGRDYHGTGYITQDLLRETLPDGDCDYYLCGSPRFMQSNYDLLRVMGVADNRIFAESFGPASLQRQSGKDGDILPPPATEALVRFEKSGVEQIWRTEEGALLDFAENHGFTPEFGCRNGACGSCSMAISQGEVTYEAMPAAGIKDGQALLCCARPKAGAEPLVLDL